MTAASRRLPAQNVVFAAVVALGTGGFALTVAVALGTPLAPRFDSGFGGPELLRTFPWPLPIVWLIAIINARGVGQLLFRSTKGTSGYGIRVFGATALLTTLFEMAFQPFASNVQHYWTWPASQTPLLGARVPYFVAFLLLVLVLLLMITPLLIDKKPGEAPPNYRPLANYVLLNSLFATGAAVHHLWLAFACSAAAILAAAIPLTRKQPAVPV
jgi:hypothetical protein